MEPVAFLQSIAFASIFRTVSLDICFDFALLLDSVNTIGEAVH